MVNKDFHYNHSPNACDAGINWNLIKVDFNNFFLVLHLQITPAVMDTNYLLHSLLVTYDITLSAVVYSCC